MKIYKHYIITIIAMITLSTSTSRGQDSVRYIGTSDTTIGIPIKKTEFDKKVSNYVKLMGDWTSFKSEDYIDMIRLYNTIGDTPLLRVDYYRMYYQVFLLMYIKKAAEVLDAKLSKGMAMYSKKYNLWIGDEPLGNGISRYKVNWAK